MWNKQNYKKRKNIKKILGLSLLGCIGSVQAEILVILPESGPLARAASNIKQGFMSAYMASGQKVPIKWVNSDQKKMSQLLKQHVNKKTQLIVGPLARQDIEALVQAQPKVKTLGLNDSMSSSPQLWQFSLSKREDAIALQKVLTKDQIRYLQVLRQPGSETEHELMLMSLLSVGDLQVDIIDIAPKSLSSKQGLLLMGNPEWLAAMRNLPKKRLYTVSNAIDQHITLPKGLKFCDVPALYTHAWPDVLNAYQQAPVQMSYQRLIAFGGDAWQISQLYLNDHKAEQLQFQGRTGHIQVNAEGLRRMPACFEYTSKGVKLI